MAVVPHGRTHGAQQGVTASAGQRHGDVEISIPPRPSGQPEPGLRPVHHARPLWAHRETEAHFTVTESSTNKQHHLSSLSAGMSVNVIAMQPIGLVPFQARCILPVAEGLATAKAAALRINLNVENCGIVAAPVRAPSRALLLLPSHGTVTRP
jgi:hypothetical protein